MHCSRRFGPYTRGFNCGRSETRPLDRKPSFGHLKSVKYSPASTRVPQSPGQPDEDRYEHRDESAISFPLVFFSGCLFHRQKKSPPPCKLRSEARCKLKLRRTPSKHESVAIAIGAFEVLPIFTSWRGLFSAVSTPIFALRFVIYWKAYFQGFSRFTRLSLHHFIFSRISRTSATFVLVSFRSISSKFARGSRCSNMSQFVFGFRTISDIMMSVILQMQILGNVRNILSKCWMILFLLDDFAPFLRKKSAFFLQMVIPCGQFHAVQRAPVWD